MGNYYYIIWPISYISCRTLVEIIYNATSLTGACCKELTPFFNQPVYICFTKFLYYFTSFPLSGADPGFQVRGEGAHLKKLRWAKGGAKNFGVFRVKKDNFKPKNHILSNCGGRREQFWGISCEKSRFYAKKSYFFPILGGRAPGSRPGSDPAYLMWSCPYNHNIF